MAGARGVPLLTLGIAAFHAAWLNAPFSILQMNAGSYFGVFVRNWDRHGFAALRGLPLMPGVVAKTGDATPYVHHPPGLAWLAYALGGQEWSMRLPTVVATLLAAVCLYRIARTRFAAAASALAAVLLAFSPGMAVIGQASYEPVVVAFGSCVMAEIVAPLRQRRLSLAILASAAFVGTWMGWGFAFLGLACPLLVLRVRSLGTGLRQLVIPGVASVVALASIVLWANWALAQDGIARLPENDRNVVEMVQKYVLAERAGPAWAWHHTLQILPITWSRWLFVAALVGLPWAAWRAPRITAALLVVGVGPFVFLAAPADFIWQTYSMPFAALCAAAPLDLIGRSKAPVVRTIGAVAGLGVAIGVVHASWVIRADASTPYFRRMGEVLSEAAQQPGWAACHNYLYAMAYYVTSPDVPLAGVYFPNQLEALRKGAGGKGWKYLWMRANEPGLVVPGMEQYLSQFPKVRVPELENCLDVEGTRVTGGIGAAWLVTLCPPAAAAPPASK